MDNIDKINQIFKSNQIELALQLIKSCNYKLRDVLTELYNRECNEYYIWFLNGNEKDYFKNYCILTDGNTLWLNNNTSFPYNTITECIDKLTEYLENYNNEL